MAHFELSKAPPQLWQMLSLWTPSSDATAPVQAQRWRAVAAASLGNALEWFDFVIYGYFAAAIARLFFPSKTDLKSLLIALATFGITVFVRPLGAILHGAFADRHGRKSALMPTIAFACRPHRRAASRIIVPGGVREHHFPPLRFRPDRADRAPRRAHRPVE